MALRESCKTRCLACKITGGNSQPMVWSCLVKQSTRHNFNAVSSALPSFSLQPPRFPEWDFQARACNSLALRAVARSATHRHQGLWNQALLVALGYTPHTLTCTLDWVFDEVIYPKSDLAGADRVRIKIIVGYSISTILDIVRIDRLNIFSWMMDLEED